MLNRKLQIFIFLTLALLTGVIPAHFGSFGSKVTAQQTERKNYAGEVFVLQKDLVGDKSGSKYDLHAVYDFQRGTVTRVKVYTTATCGNSGCIEIIETETYSK